MSSRPGASIEMGEPGERSSAMEERLRRIASAFPYPATPDIAIRERKRLERRSLPWKRHPHGLALGLAVVMLIAAVVVLFVTPVRARVLEWIRIGAVRIFFVTPTLPAPSTIETPDAVASPEPAATPTMLKSPLDLSGETTWQKAQDEVDFPILLPGFPADLGSPDHIYLQRLADPIVMLVWMDPDRPGEVLMSLSESSSDRVMFNKFSPKSVLETQLNGRPAVWVEGDYLLMLRSGDVTMTRLMDQGHTLIWTSDDGQLTFRLETDVDLDEAVRIAESVR